MVDRYSTAPTSGKPYLDYYNKPSSTGSAASSVPAQRAVINYDHRPLSSTNDKDTEKRKVQERDVRPTEAEYGLPPRGYRTQDADYKNPTPPVRDHSAVYPSAVPSSAASTKPVFSAIDIDSIKRAIVSSKVLNEVLLKHFLLNSEEVLYSSYSLPLYSFHTVFFVNHFNVFDFVQFKAS